MGGWVPDVSRRSRGRCPAGGSSPAPDSPEAAEVVDRLLAGADATRRAAVRERLAAGLDSQSERYHRLLAVINGEQPRPSHGSDLEWLMTAIDNHPG
jgi:hypothetical protein